MTFTPLGIATAVITGVLTPLTVWAIQNTFKTLKRANALSVKFASAKAETEKALSDLRKDVDAQQALTCKDIETLKTNTKRDIDSLKTGSQQTDIRVQRVEDAIVDIRAAAQRSDEQFTAIMLELKVLPRLDATIGSFTRDIAGIVPRVEMETRWKSIEDRLNRFESERRGAR